MNITQSRDTFVNDFFYIAHGKLNSLFTVQFGFVLYLNVYAAAKKKLYTRDRLWSRTYAYFNIRAHMQFTVLERHV